MALTAAIRGTSDGRSAFLSLAAAYAVYGIGDIFMCWGESYAMLGMVTFFLGHALYVCAVFLSDRVPTEKLIPYYASDSKRSLCSILAGVGEEVIIAGLTLYLYLTSGDLVFSSAGLVYVSTFPVIIAAVCSKMHRGVQIGLSFLGTVFYATSDFTIAFRHLFGVKPFMPVFIMATYYAALFFFFTVFIPVIIDALKQSPPKTKTN